MAQTDKQKLEEVYTKLCITHFDMEERVDYDAVKENVNEILKSVENHIKEKKETS